MADLFNVLLIISLSITLYMLVTLLIDSIRYNHMERVIRKVEADFHKQNEALIAQIEDDWLQHIADSLEEEEQL